MHVSSEQNAWTSRWSMCWDEGQKINQARTPDHTRQRRRKWDPAPWYDKEFWKYEAQGSTTNQWQLITQLLRADLGWSVAMTERCRLTDVVNQFMNGRAFIFCMHDPCDNFSFVKCYQDLQGQICSILKRPYLLKYWLYCIHIDRHGPCDKSF